MQKRLAALAAGVTAVVILGASSVEKPTWRELDPDNTLVIDIEGKDGPVIIEMAHEFAPGHVERIKKLAGQKFYDGTPFHRVIPDFMAQGGDPQGTGMGGSDEPDLKAEFSFQKSADPDNTTDIGEYQKGYTTFYKGFKVAQRLKDDALSSGAVSTTDAWVTHCPGTAAMARSASPDSANSQFYLTTGDARFLDTQYTAWGQVVWGQDVVLSIKQGEPVQNPDRIKTMRVMADIPEDERVNLKIMRADSARFQGMLESMRKESGALPDICEIDVPVEMADGE